MSSSSFRPLARSDFPALCDWLAQPHVARWWADDASPEGVEADYGGVVDGTDATEVFIAYRDGAAVGLVQRYCLDNEPAWLDELQTVLPVAPNSWGMDFLIGSVAHTGRGWGTEMIAAFTARLWHDHAPARAVVVPVHVANLASWRALERAGYTRVATGLLEPDNPADHRRHHIYRVDRPPE